MLCKQPYMIGVVPVGCGKCFHCRLNKKRLWLGRLLLEHADAENSCFVTLTYSEDKIPEGGTLEPSHVRDWIKRIRKLVSPEKIRYFYVGEYGEESNRPHYHAILFGISPAIAGGFDGEHGLVAKSWNLGFTFVGNVTRDSIQYVCGYVVKKLTSKEDIRLNGRYPEFARMSLRPGIGVEATRKIAAEIESSDVGLERIAESGDVPVTFKMGGKSFPFGRLLRRKLRRFLGFKSEDAPDCAIEKYAQEMRELYEIALNDKENKKASLSGIELKLNKQKMINREKRIKIFEQKRGTI